MKLRRSPLLLCLWLTMSLAVPVVTGTETMRIGVLANRGKDTCLKQWTLTAEYLTKRIPGYRFTIVPLEYGEVENAVKSKEIEFLLANPAISVAMEVKYGAHRLVTLEKKSASGQAFNVYGAVIFCRRAETTINNLADLKNRTFMAVEKNAFCGGYSTWELMLKNHIDPAELKSISYGGTQDAVVMAVKKGQVDAGTVRTDILENMAASGAIRLEDFKIINRVYYPPDRFPFLCSTLLYPEWPLSELRIHKEDDLGEQIMIALLQMSASDPAAVAAGLGGWSAPLSYLSVEDCLKLLHVEPFENFGRITWKTAIARYWRVLTGILLVMAVILAFAVYSARVNRRLRVSMAERALELSRRTKAEEEMRRIFNIAGDGMRVIGTDMKIIEVNEQFVHMTGYSREELIGHHCADYALCEKLCNTEKCAIFQVMKSRQRLEYDCKLKTKDSYLPCLVTSVPYFDSNGETIGVIQNYKDISDRIRIEEVMSQEAEQRGRTQMAGTVLHDIGNAVTGLGSLTIKLTGDREWEEVRSIAMLGKMVKDGKEKFISALGETQTSELIDFLEKLHNSLERRHQNQSEISRRIAISVCHIQDVLSLQRMYAGSGKGAMTKCSLREVITDAVSMQSASLQKRNITIAANYDTTIANVKLDKTRMIQVFINLLKNVCESFDACSDDRKCLLEVKLVTENDRVVLTIADNGSGFSPEVAANLFANGFTTKNTGSGIGLYQCRSIVESHGGTIELSSPGLGQGAVVTIILPIAS